MTIKNIWMAMLIVLSLGLLMSAASAQTVNIADGGADTGNTTTVTITADGVTDLANFDITVTYNPDVVIVTDAANDAAFGVAVNNLENAADGWVRIASLNFGAGQTGDGILLSTLTLEAVGTADQTSDLTLTINELKNSSEGVITATLDDGLFTVTGGVAETTDDITINEIMYAPTNTWGGQYNEWIELYNNDTKDVDITGWAIGDKTISAGTTMQPGDYVIIAKNDTKFAEYYSDACTVIKVTITLSNTGEIIYLNDSSSSVVDYVNYTEYQDLAKNNNKTLERNATGGWEASLDDGGTPCAENSVLGELPALTVTAVPASVTKDTATEVTFNVTSEGTAVDGALVTLLGCGVDTNSTTDVSGTVTISVNATDAGTINVTATKDAYEEATATITATMPAAPAISISDGGADTGNTTTVTITADGVTDLANFDITVTYNPDVVIVTDAANDAAFGVAVNNLENAADGWVRIASLNFGAGQTGDGILLSTLTLEAVGTADQTSDLTLTINELKNSSEGVITATLDDGLFTVTGDELPALTVTAVPTSVTNNTTTEVKFNVTSEGAPVDDALVTLTGCGADTSGTTGADGIATISVTANATGAIGVTATKTGYDEATTTVTVTAGVTTSPLNVTAVPTSVTNNTTTEVKFNVTSEGAPVDDALVTLTGCGADTSGTTGADGIATISVTANATGAIGVTATKTGYDEATTTVTVTAGVTTSPLNVTAVPTSVTNNTTTEVKFNVTSEGAPVDDALVTLTGCGADTSGTTGADGIATISVTANATGAIGVTATKTGYDEATTTVTVTAGVTTSPLNVTAVPTSVTNNTTTEVKFNVTSEGAPVDDALVTLTGCGADTSGTTGADGIATISVTANATGAIGVTATKTGYDEATTTVTVTAGVTTSPLNVTAVPTSVTNNTTTEVKFNVTSEGAPVDDALVTLTGCGADTSGTTGADGIATISVTANATGAIGVTATKTGYDEATTTVTVTAGVTTSPLNVTAVPTSVTNNTTTEVKFNVTSEGAPVDDALVTLTGCGADTSGTTGADGIATISVTANATGAIGVTATKTGYDEATTTVTVTAGVTTSPLNVTAVPTSVTNNTTTEVKFNVTSEGAPVDDALVTLTGCGADTSGTTGADGIATISVTANATGAIGVTATKTGYDEATTTVTVTAGVTTSPLNVTAVPTSVTNNTTTEVKFNVTSEGAPVDDALVTLTGCGADTSGTTGADGIATISVTANATGAIGVTATKTGYDEATTTVTVTAGVTTSPLNVTAVPTSVTNNTTTEVKFNVTSEGAPVDDALVTLTGCGADTSGTTGADGIATISVTANATGAIGVTATKTGYDEATTTVTVTAGVTTSPLNVTAVPTSVTNNTTTEVKFNVTSEGAPVDDALVTLTGCGADTSGTTGADGIATISVTANATGAIGVTATKTGYDEATTTVTVTAGVTTSPLNVTAVPTSVTNNTTTEVKFNVTSEGAPVDDALVTLTGCGADTSGTTGADGIATISITANATGAINVKATKTGYVDAVTTITVNGPESSGNNTTPVISDFVNVTGNYTGTAYVKALGDPTGEVGTTIGLGDDMIPFKGANVTIDQSLDAGEWVRIEMSYTDDELGDIDEDYLEIYKFNKTAGVSGEWELVKEQQYCIDHDKNKADNYLWVKVDELSIFTRAGKEKVPPTSTPTTTGGGGGGGDGTYPPGWDDDAPASTPAATTAPTDVAPEPTVASTEAPTDEVSTEAPTDEVSTEAPTTEMKTKGTPGFGAVLTVFTIAGLLVATYLVMRRRE